MTDAPTASEYVVNVWGAVSTAGFQAAKTTEVYETDKAADIGFIRLHLDGPIYHHATLLPTHHPTSNSVLGKAIAIENQALILFGQDDSMPNRIRDKHPSMQKCSEWFSCGPNRSKSFAFYLAN